MSQVKFNTTYKGLPAQVVSGWDRPLGYYHLTIYNVRLDADEDVLWDGLSKLGFCRDIKLLREVIEGLGIKPPPDFYERVALNEGNVLHSYSESKGWTVRRL